MNSEFLGVLLMLALLGTLAIPIGRMIANVYSTQKSLLDPVCGPIERSLFRLSGIDEQRAMGWKEQLYALLSLNLIWFLVAMFVLMNMGWLPLNPDGNPSMSPDLAFNTAISFIANTNLQHYAGETAVSYLGQLILMLFQFISAAAGMAICAYVFLTMRPAESQSTSNFYFLFVRSITRILLPLSFVVAIVLVWNGVPMTFHGKEHIVGLQGEQIDCSQGPVAAFVAIKQLGTNGGGFYGTNSAHPLENPSYFTNVLECVSILLIPISMIIAFGRIIRRQAISWMILGVMTLLFALLLVPTISWETAGNPALNGLSISQTSGSMEGKEVRFGSAASALWAVSTTCSSNGSVNSMHDSLTPLSGMTTLLGMMVNCVYGGVGVGFLNFYVFIILAVFISGLMVGRTPEFLSKKIEAREMKIAMIVALLHPLLILGGTALASHLYANSPTGYSAWLNNPGYHGFTEMLYEFSSSSANNGSGFEGLGDNTPFWNIACGIVMILSRFIPIIGPVAIAGLLSHKKSVPESAGSLKVESGVFAAVVLAVILIVAALSFFPALALGPIAEYFSL